MTETSWPAQARQLTEQNERAGRHEENERIWNKIRKHLVALQRKKCAYCERDPERAGVEWSVDHYRPKGKIKKRWGLPEETVDTGGDSEVGYYLLAYDVNNYVAACRNCNRMKSNYFPTRRDRQVRTADPEALAEEEPYLINPADPQEIDPETAIAWRGIVPQAGDISPADRQRALVTIDVLDLNRDELREGRILVLLGVWWNHQDVLANGDPEAKRNLDVLCAPESPHSSCARYFRRLCETDRDAAEAEFTALCRILMG